jgi:hypothetical protein
MIIRIMGEGQYEVPGSLFDELNIIDNRIVDLVGKGNEADYRTELLNLINVIKSNGKQIDDSSIVESNIIVPPEDLSLKEAKEMFSGSGLLED